MLIQARLLQRAALPRYSIATLYSYSTDFRLLNPVVGSRLTPPHQTAQSKTQTATKTTTQSIRAHQTTGNLTNRITMANEKEAPRAESDSHDYLLNAKALTRRLTDKAAVCDVSLALKKGDILGLLGLNGAGKSSTLKMLCGMFKPDSGSVTINGFSMTDSPLQARAHIGFLPDQPPVYNDMRVNEYLKLCGQIRGLRGLTLSARQATVTEQCSLGDVQKKLIGSLSKGYRQRVGLAQAIIHQPAVVLLDEPGNGLDPRQQENMRALIRGLAEQQVVIFSTHLLAEAKTTCNRIAIMHEGRLFADHLSADDDLETVFRGITG